MKKMNILMIAVAMLGMAISCNKNADIPQTKSLSATASIDGEDQTKTVYAEDKNASNKPILKVNWDANETFKAYYEGSSTPLIFTKENGESFVATDVPGGVTASTPFVGVYGEKVTYNPSTGKYTIDYSGQDGKLENLAKYDAMVATSMTDAQGLHFPFKHRSSFVKVTLKRGNHTHDNLQRTKYFSIIFDECQLNDDNLDVVGWPSRKNSFKVNFTLDTELALNETRVFYIAIPPITGVNNVYPQVLISGGYQKLVSCYATGMTFEAGKMYETEITYACGTNHSGWD